MEVVSFLQQGGCRLGFIPARAAAEGYREMNFELHSLLGLNKSLCSYAGCESNRYRRALSRLALNLNVPSVTVADAFY